MSISNFYLVKPARRKLILVGLSLYFSQIKKFKIKTSDIRLFHFPQNGYKLIGIDSEWFRPRVWKFKELRCQGNFRHIFDTNFFSKLWVFQVIRSNLAHRHFLFFFSIQKYFTLLSKFLDFLWSPGRLKLLIRVIISEF